MGVDLFLHQRYACHIINLIVKEALIVVTPLIDNFRTIISFLNSSNLDCDTVTQLDDEFNIMNWWHQHKLTYPVLSVLAKDILTVPVSTISP